MNIMKLFSYNPRAEEAVNKEEKQGEWYKFPFWKKERPLDLISLFEIKSVLNIEERDTIEYSQKLNSFEQLNISIQLNSLGQFGDKTDGVGYTNTLV